MAFGWNDVVVFVGWGDWCVGADHQIGPPFCLAGRTGVVCVGRGIGRLRCAFEAEIYVDKVCQQPLWERIGVANALRNQTSLRQSY